MDPKGHIYEGTDEKPVKPEDAARLDGYLKARAEADAKDMAEEKILQKAAAVAGIVSGSSAPSSAPKMVNRCPHCMEELYEADNGYGGVRLACKTHGFDRYPIVTVPAWVEADCKRFPDLATRWLGFLLDRDFSWPADDTPEDRDRESVPKGDEEE